MFDRLAVEGAGCAFTGWRLVSVAGKDAERFLHSQLTADVAGLADGRSTLSALLDRSGRLQAFFYVGRRGDGFRLLVPAAAHAAALKGLEANLIADRVEITPVQIPSMRLAIGPATNQLLPHLGPDEVFALEIYGHRGFVTWASPLPDLPELKQEEVETLRVHGRELSFEVGESRVRARVEPLPLLVVADREAEAEQLFLHSVNASNHDRDDEAVALLERAVAVSPNFADAYEALGVIHRRRGAHEAAINALERLLEVDPESVMAHSNLSVIHAQLGHIEEAELELAEAARARLAAASRQSNDSAEQERRRSQQLQEIDERERMFSQILELDPEDPLANFSMGELYLRAERYAEAAAHLQRTLAADPEYSAAFLALGRAFEGTGNLDQAAAIYADGIEVAAAKGALLAANQMQDRLTALSG